MYNHVTQEKCSFCLEKKQHIQNFRYLCNDCFQLLRPAKLKTNCLVSLYEYTAELRYILLQAKTCGDKFAISCLVELVSKNIYTQLLLEQADFIMPAPSSLWSRLRGKTDFTWFLVRALAQKNNLERLYKKLGISEKGIINLENCGNTVSSSIPIAMEEFTKNNNKKEVKILLVGFGVGLSWGITSVRI